MRVIAILMLVAGATPLWGQSQLLLQPTDEEPGDQYRIMFLTSQTRDATSTDIDDYNVFVQQVADAAPIVGSWDLDWSVVGSTESVSARTNTGTDYGDSADSFGVPIYRLDGVQLVSDYRGLWQPADFSVSVPGGTNLTELGTKLTPIPEWENLGVVAFTGTSRSGFAQSSDYLGGLSTQVGTTFTSANFDWFEFGGSPGADNEFPFYAMSEVITAVPEPTSNLLALIAFVFVITASGNRRRRSRRIDT